MLKMYYTLTKPGIISGNAITAAAGFFVASKGNINGWLFLVTLLGLSLIIASGCAFNNYIDRDLDTKMERTKHRALAKRLISPKNALIFATILGLIGVFLLACFTNLLTVAIALAGFLVYVVLYSLLKPKSVHGTVIGSIAGAVPPVVGYCAVTGCFDLGALILFFIVVLWQMPHFFSIAIYRLDDYAAASIPIYPIKKGIVATKNIMMIYIIAFILVSASLTLFGYTGPIYLLITTAIGLAWLYLCLQGFKASNNKLWARKMFILSLIMITVQCIVMSLDVVKA